MSICCAAITQEVFLPMDSGDDVAVSLPLSGCVVGVKTFPELLNSLGFYSIRGNILLARRGQDEVSYRLDGQTLRARSSNISVALIDFTLSRLDAEGRVLFCDLTADTWLFEGPKGDVQVGADRDWLLDQDVTPIQREKEVIESWFERMF